MSKELTPLEALKELKFQVGSIKAYTHDLKELTFKVREMGLFEIIETALKEWELWKDNLKCGDFEDNRTKALEIIKEKGISMWALEISNNVEQYNSIRNGCCYDVCAFVKELTQEEFDLLKEVLL